MSTSTITPDYKKLLGNLWLSDIDSGGSTYYVGIGRSLDNDISNVLSDTRRKEMVVRHELQSIKVANQASMVVPTVEWQANTVYNAWDDNNSSLTNFYVLNQNREVFVCIQTAKTNQGVEILSTVEPSTSLITGKLINTFKTSDGYLWRYLYTMSNIAFSNFKNNSYMPVKFITGTPTILSEVGQKTLQDSAISGEIIGIAIDSGGTGYSVNPSISIQGNGSSAVYNATVYNGRIVRVEIDSDGEGNRLHGTGYDFAKVEPSYGNAVLRPIIAPRGGLNKDPVNTLFAKSVMMQVDFENNENNTILAQNEFKTVSLFRNLKKYNGDSDLTVNTANAMNYLNIANISGSFVNDEDFNNTSLTAFGKVFYQDGTKLYYFQNDSTGFGEFLNGEVVQSTSGATAEIQSLGNPEFDRYSGEILYINNVDGIQRASNQTEDIRIVIELE
jgi:hypothetical protein